MTETMTLRDLIRVVAQDNPQAQPAEIAHSVATLTPEDQLLDFYEETLRPIVADVLRAERRLPTGLHN